MLATLLPSGETEVITIVATVAFPDRQAAAEATRYDVSIGVRQDYADGYGNSYPGIVLHHLALTANPVIPELGPWHLVGHDNQKGPVYEKEIAFTGAFLRQADGTVTGITQEGLDELAANSHKLLGNQVQIPVQVSHEVDGQQFGKLIGLRLSKALKYGNRDPENISEILGDGAATSALVVLSQEVKQQGTETMAESNGTTETDVTELAELAKDLGVTFSEGASKDDKIKALRAAAQGMKVKLSEAAKEDESAKTNTGERNVNQSQSANQAQAQVPSIPDSMLDSLVTAREVEIDSFVGTGISPAQATQAKARYATKAAVVAALSQKADASYDDFKAFAAIDNGNLAESGRTKLSDDERDVELAQSKGKGGDSGNVLLKMAKADGLLFED